MDATAQETQTWWYRANKMSCAGEIERVEVVRVTDQTVAYVTPHDRRPRREGKETQWGKWFDKEADAVDFQRKRLGATVSRTRSALASAEDALTAFNEAHPLSASEG